MVIPPPDATAINKPVVALLLCNIAVIPKPASIPKNGLFKLDSMSINIAESFSGCTASFIRFIPKKSIPKPIMTCDISLIFFFFATKCTNTPMPIKIGAIVSILKDTNSAVTVVPMLAPIIIPIACCKFISPAFTKPTVITVVALLLCIIIVTIVPTINPINLFFVRTASMFFIFSPAAL